MQIYLCLIRCRKSASVAHTTINFTFSKIEEVHSRSVVDHFLMEARALSLGGKCTTDWYLMWSLSLRARKVLWLWQEPRLRRGGRGCVSRACSGGGGGGRGERRPGCSHGEPSTCSPSTSPLHFIFALSEKDILCRFVSLLSCTGLN